MPKLILLIILMASVVTLVNSTKSKKCKHEDNDSAMQRFVNANMALTGKYLYQHLYQSPQQSFTIVTLPISCVAGQLAFHTQGVIYKRLLKLMGLKNKNEIKSVLSTAVWDINNESETTSKITLKLFGDASQSFTKSFKQDFKDICNGETGLIDYDCPDQAIREINKWFNRHSSTDSSIPLRNAEKFNADDKKGIAFATFMEFTASFDHKANPNGLIDIDFEVTKNKSLKFPSLFGNGYFKYVKSDDLDAQIIQIHLKGGYIAVLYYPNDPDNLLELMRKIQDPKVFYGGLDRAKWMCLKIHITIGHADVSNNLFEFVPELHLNGTNFENVFRSRDPAHVFYGFQKLNLIADTEVRKGPLNSKLCPGDHYPFVKMNHGYAYYVMGPNRMNVYGGIILGPQNYDE